MIKPPSWLDPDGIFGMDAPTTCTNASTCGWRGAGCTGEKPADREEDNLGCVSQWYSNWTFIPGEPTIEDDSPLRTYKLACDMNRLISGFDSCKQMPWRAPGSAPIWSPCGVDGGNPQGCPAGNPGKAGCVGGGYGHGPDGRSLKGNTQPTQWHVGEIVEVAFGITANHGGGYQYRLCAVPEGGFKDLTEDCFQKLPLPFVGATQWLQYGSNESDRVTIPAMRVSNGTVPAGSEWTRNPVPACGGIEGGGKWDVAGLCIGSQFPPPAPGAKGFYGPTIVNPDAGSGLRSLSVVDQVQVPHHLNPGEYVLSYRIDCEQTPQVWNQCSSITIVA